MRAHVYLGLAIIGTLLPVAFFAQHFAASGMGIDSFLAGAFAHPVASGLTSDLLISSAVFWVWMFSHRQGPSPWPFVALNLLVGLSLALPLYLWMTLRRSPHTHAAADG
ncbi:MAG: DUF2834 domain-containing protein [Pseudomonadales bacterium]